MLRIRPEQMRILTDVTRRAFVRRMAEHLRAFHAAEAERRFGGDDAALDAFVEAAMTEAADLGIGTRDAVRRYLEDKLVSPGTEPQGRNPALPETPVGVSHIDDPVESMPRRSLACRFVETRVRCGDVAHIEVVAQGLPDGTPVSMEILRIADGTVLTGTSGALDGPSSRFEWYPTRFPGMTGQDGFILRALATDLVARGSEVLTFETDPPVAAELRTVECRDEAVAWTGRYRIAYDGERVLVGTRIRLVNRHGPVPVGGDAPPPAGEPLPTPVLAFIREETERFLSGRFGLVREGCRLGMGCSCVKPVAIQVDFVEQDEDHAVNLYSGEPHPGSARGSAVAWTLTRLWQGQWAHAVGHLLGWLDDTQDPAGLMGAGVSLRPGNLAEVQDWMKARTGQRWLLVPTDVVQ